MRITEKTTVECMKKAWARCVMRAICAALAISVMLASPAIWNGVAKAENTTALEQKLSALKGELNTLSGDKTALQSAYDSIMSEQQDAVEQKANLDSQIENLEQQISAQNDIIVALDEQISAKQEELDTLEIKRQNTYEIFKKRLRAIYESGSASYIEVLFSATDINDLLDKAELLSAVSEHDDKIIADLAATMRETETAKEAVLSDKTELGTQQAELEQSKTELENKKDSVEALISRLEDKKTANRDEVEAVLDKEEALAKSIAATARKITEESKPKEETSPGNSDESQSYSGGSLQWPLPGHTRISSEFGYRIHPILGTRRFHSGVDIPAGSGTPIKAADDGTVAEQEYSSVYGNYIMINHGGGVVTMYAHMKSAKVSSGDSVSKGDTIGYVGSTGWSTGAHLHFEVIKNGTQTNPMNYFK